MALARVLLLRSRHEKGGLVSTFKHILVPTDFGDSAQAGLDAALSLASRADARVTLCHAYTMFVPIYNDAAWVPTAELERPARHALDEALAKAKKSYPRTESKLGCGDPALEILRAATSLGIDLIVIGTHGRRGLSRVLLGSVAEKVVRSSPVPVLTVPSAEDRSRAKRPLTQSRFLRSVLVGQTRLVGRKYVGPGIRSI